MNRSLNFSNSIISLRYMIHFKIYIILNNSILCSKMFLTKNYHLFIFLMCYITFLKGVFHFKRYFSHFYTYFYLNKCIFYLEMILSFNVFYSIIFFRYMMHFKTCTILNNCIQCFKMFVSKNCWSLIFEKCCVTFYKCIFHVVLV